MTFAREKFALAARKGVVYGFRMNQDRETFNGSELTICLSHYDLGTIESVRPYPRGSRKSPKVLISSQNAKYLFKRRARGKDDPHKVAFCHELQHHLAAQNFPLPHLIRTIDGNTMLSINNHIYELFEFIDAGMYDGTLDSTFDAGRILGLYHKLVLDFCNTYNPPTGSYHDASAVAEAIHNTVTSLPQESRPSLDVLKETVTFLEGAYLRCAAETEKEGLKEWPIQIVHGDWHPGNMLFRDRLVAAVIDYDSARMYQRVIDLANGALQFSIIGGSDDPTQWPDGIDMTRLKRFMRGYDSVNVVSRSELMVLPYLMCEAAIAESVLPIAATGSFGRMQGFPFLQMIQRKISWVLGHLPELQSIPLD